MWEVSTPAFLVQLSALPEVLLCFVKDKGKGSDVWVRSKSRAITSLSFLMPSTMHTSCVHCSSMLPAPLMVLQPDTSSCSQAKEPRLLCTEANLPKSAGSFVPPLHCFLFPRSLRDEQFQKQAAMEDSSLLWVCPLQSDLVLWRTFTVFFLTGAKLTFPNHCL